MSRRANRGHLENKKNNNNAAKDPASDTNYSVKVASVLSSMHHTFKAAIDRYEEKETKKNTCNDPEHLLASKTFKWIAGYTVVTTLILIVNVCQWQLARDSEHRQFRAYVGPVHNSYNIDCEYCNDLLSNPNAKVPVAAGLVPVDQKNTIRFTIQNYGTSPALNIIACGDLVSRDIDTGAGRLIENVLKRCEASTLTRSPTVWPSEQRPQGIPINDLESVRSIYAKGRTGFLVAEVTYDDIFGDRHHSFICREVIPRRSDPHLIDLRGCNLSDVPVQKNDD